MHHRSVIDASRDKRKSPGNHWASLSCAIQEVYGLGKHPVWFHSSLLLPINPISIKCSHSNSALKDDPLALGEFVNCAVV